MGVTWGGIVRLGTMRRNMMAEGASHDLGLYVLLVKKCTNTPRRRKDYNFNNLGQRLKVKEKYFWRG